MPPKARAKGKKTSQKAATPEPAVEAVVVVEPVTVVEPKKKQKKSRQDDAIPDGTYVVYYEDEEKAGVIYNSDDEKPKQRAIFLNPDKSGFVYYPNGRMALALTQTSAGFLCYAYSKKGTQLASFDAQAIGSAMYPNKKLWFLTTAKGVQVLRPDGSVELDVLWENSDTLQPITLQLSQTFTLICKSRHDIVLQFSCQNVAHEFQVGQMLSRTDTYMDKVTFGKGVNRGKANVDITRVRERQAQQAAEEEARKAPKKSSEFKHQELGAIVDILSTIKVDKTTGRLTPDSSAPLTPSPSGAGGGDGLDGTTGSSALGSTQSSIGGESVILPASGRYVPGKVKKSTRKRLRVISSKDYDETLRQPRWADKLVLVTCLADWAKTTALERVLEAMNGVIHKTHPHCILLKHDLGESRNLQERYKFRQPPMFFVYYNGHLVYARDTMANYGRTKADILQQLDTCYKLAQQSQFLPDTFTFSAGDNNLAHTILGQLESRLSASRLRYQPESTGSSQPVVETVVTTTTTVPGT